MLRKRTLVMMRGLPGSGKSTLAKEIALDHLHYGGSSVAICSTDDYHMVDGKYVFQPDKLGYFHQLNQRRACDMMDNDVELVIIDNTNVKRADMQIYIDLATQFDYKVEEVLVGEDELFPNLEDASPHKFADYINLCAKRNTHGVPRDAIERMARRFDK